MKTHMHSWGAFILDQSETLIVRCRECGVEYEWEPSSEMGPVITAAQYRSGLAITDGRVVKYLAPSGELLEMAPFPSKS